MRRTSCRICDQNILVSSADFTELCIACGSEFREMMIAVAELSTEMANANCLEPDRPQSNAPPAVPIEEIAIRMELNRIKKKT